ncbi:hypothetical protein Gasu2_10370 [Galdieria sulphuraria]|nr:hypothetical protein Gasu2_10370 [Galdieria sulphuraria]
MFTRIKYKLINVIETFVLKGKQRILAVFITSFFHFDMSLCFFFELSVFLWKKILLSITRKPYSLRLARSINVDIRVA